MGSWLHWSFFSGIKVKGAEYKCMPHFLKFLCIQSFFKQVKRKFKTFTHNVYIKWAASSAYPLLQYKLTSYNNKLNVWLNVYINLVKLSWKQKFLLTSHLSSGWILCSWWRLCDRVSASQSASGRGKAWFHKRQGKDGGGAGVGKMKWKRTWFWMKCNLYANICNLYKIDKK